METPYKWRQFQYGNISLQTFPPSSNLNFRTEFPLPEEQRCLLDNLWRSFSRNPKGFPTIMHALASHFAYLNDRLNHLPLPSSPSSSVQTLSLQPSTPERIRFLEKENEKIKSELEKTRKEREDKSRETAELKKKYEELKGKKAIDNHSQESQNNDNHSQLKVFEKECFFDFKNQNVFSLDLAEKIQNILWSLEASPNIPAGLAFSLQVFKKDCCDNCKKGFSIIQVSLDLNFFRPFTFGGILLSVETLWQLGFLSRLIICSHEEIEQIPHWKLRHFLYCLFENHEFSFLDLMMEVLPGLGIDRTRYKIKVAIQEQAAPIQRRNGLSHLKRPSPVNEQLTFWRQVLLATFPKMAITMPLAFEDEILKVYCTRTTYYVPFSQIVVDQPEIIEHMKATHASLSLHFFGDYCHYALPIRELLDSPLPTSPGNSMDPTSPVDPVDGEYFDDLDSIGLANLENQMEK